MPLFRYRNSSSLRQFWPSIQRLNGSTLELGPGEECDLDHVVTAQHLERVQPKPKRRRRHVVSPPDPPAAPAPPLKEVSRRAISL